MPVKRGLNVCPSFFLKTWRIFTYLLDGLGQPDGLLHRILLSNLIDLCRLVVRFLNIDHLVGIPVDIIGPDVDSC